MKKKNESVKGNGLTREKIKEIVSSHLKVSYFQ